MADFLSSSSGNFDDTSKPKTGSVDPELDNFLMVEKQKAQFTAQVNKYSCIKQLNNYVI